MAFTPLTTVRLLSNVPLTRENEHQLYFVDNTERATYFQSKAMHTMTNATYQKEKNVIRVNKTLEELLSCNYVMWQNANHSTKWIYAFIVEKEYINPEMTHVHIEIDAWNTYQFSLAIRASFVEREHCKLYNIDGSPVVNTQPEGLELGTEYDVVKNEVYEGGSQHYYLLACTTSLVDAFNSGIPENPPLPTPKVVQGMLTGLDYYLLSDNDETYNPDPPPQGTTFWPWPVATTTPISSYYGMRTHPISGDVKMHYGTDFDGVANDPVYAVHLGTVVYAQETGGFGKYVVVHHDDDGGLTPSNHFTGYAHLSSINVTKGQIVEAGQRVGNMGTTGDSTGVHLHFNLANSLFGTYQNPDPWLGITTLENP